MNSSRERRVTPVSAAGTFLALVLFTMPLPQIGSLTTVLGASTAEQTWILSSMSVGLASGMLITGAIGDDHGRRRMFVVGGVVVALASVLAVVSTSPILFIVARVLQGIGAAALISCSLGLIGHAHRTGPARIRATGIWGASVGAGIAVGPIYCVVLDEHTGWRTPYLVVAAAAVLVTVAAATLIDESRSATRRSIDIPGALLLGAGTAVFLAGLVTGRGGWLRLDTIALLVVGVVLVAAFVAVEWRSGRAQRVPLLDLRLFANPHLTAVTVAGVATGLSVIAVMSFLPLLMLRGLGLSAILAAAAIAIWSGISVPVALLARRLPASGGHQLVSSLVVVSAGVGLLTGVVPGDGFLRLVPGLVIAGLGSGVLNAALGRQAVASVPPDRAGMGSGINNTARYLGSAIGVTIVAVIATAGDAAGLIAGWDVAVAVAALFAAVGAVIVLVCVRRGDAGARA